MILGLDFDGVILDIVPVQMALAAIAPWHRRVSPAEVVRGHLRNDLERTKNDTAFYDLLYGEATLKALPVPGVREALMALPDKPFLVSARRGSHVREALSWLSRQELLPFFQDVRFVPVSAAKDTACRELGVDVYVDDHDWVLGLMASVATRILFDPWDALPDTPFRRVRSWDELSTDLARR